MKTYEAPSIKMMQMNMKEDILALSQISNEGATDVYNPSSLF